MVCVCVVYLPWINLLSWWRTQWPVGDSGQPLSVIHQCEHTEHSIVNDWRSVLRDLPRLYGWRSSSVSQSLEYSNMYVLISTASSISNGRLLSLYNKTSQHPFYFSADTFCTQIILIICSKYLFLKTSDSRPTAVLHVHHITHFVMLQMIIS